MREFIFRWSQFEFEDPCQAEAFVEENDLSDTTLQEWLDGEDFEDSEEGEWRSFFAGPIEASSLEEARDFFLKKLQTQENVDALDGTTSSLFEVDEFSSGVVRNVHIRELGVTLQLSESEIRDLTAPEHLSAGTKEALRSVLDALRSKKKPDPKLLALLERILHKPNL